MIGGQRECEQWIIQSPSLSYNLGWVGKMWMGFLNHQAWWLIAFRGGGFGFCGCRPQAYPLTKALGKGPSLRVFSIKSRFKSNCLFLWECDWVVHKFQRQVWGCLSKDFPGGTVVLDPMLSSWGIRKK